MVFVTKNPGISAFWICADVVQNLVLDNVQALARSKMQIFEIHSVYFDKMANML